MGYRPQLDLSDKAIVLIGAMLALAVLVIFGGGGLLLLWGGLWEATLTLWGLLAAFLVWAWRQVRRHAA